MKEINKILQRSTDLAKVLANTLSAQSLDNAGKVKLNKQISSLLSHTTVVEEMLQQILNEYAVEVNNAKLIIWERKLLDLTLRNNLLNMKVRSNAIPFSYENIAALEDELFDGKEIVLEQKELKPIYRSMRTNLEESGANTLFLTLGSLKWQENIGGKEYSAPLLLMPVEMVSLGKNKYAIHRRDEETIFNFTLIEFLKQNFEIEINGLNPLPQDNKGVDVNLVLHIVTEAIKEQKNWRVEEDSVIGIFSFTKYVMWNDIHKHSQAMVSNDLVHSIIEGRLLVNDNTPQADARDMDTRLRPDILAIPVEADSSQLEAIVETDLGRSFVLFGPPGTGKSQTITNLIANAVYHGKRVLFVAQKKAALEVVKSRLEKIGLDPFCLELHSNKMDKKIFLSQLQKSIDVTVNSNEEEYKRVADSLYSQRLQLVSYINALHRKHKCELSLYECIERYISLGTKPLELNSDFFREMTLEGAEEVCSKIMSLESANSILGCEPIEHPLYGMMPKKQEDKSSGYARAYATNDTVDKLLPTLIPAVKGIKQQIERAQKMSMTLKTTRQYIENDYKFKKFLAIAYINEELLEDIDALVAAVDRWNENISQLPIWQKYADLLNVLYDVKLEKAVDSYLNGISPCCIKDAFMAAYYKGTAETIIRTDTTLSSFNGLLFEQVIDKYTALTTEFQSLTRKELVAKLSANIPLNTRDEELSAELTLLRKRIGSKGRGASIRNIIDHMPNLLPRICPVMLMSPLSVAQYIDINGPKFDIVVFDEASQMQTSEAIGSIARAKTAVIVGDPKQMPPTNFFTLNTTDEEDADIDDLESILDDCISLSMPTRYLGWHYRSKHESLIAFSNKNYYDNKLITFPSADDLKSHVKWQKVEGYYDYGKTRTNTAEAEAITDEVINRLRSEPERSLGIVAFSRQQSDLIEDILAEKLSKHPELERQNRQSTEPLFVKNLENVQGDERDVILFSVGYGPDKEGHISMNFGPLNKAGGERRLNVAVSRARYEMKVFSTLTPEQIDERRTQSEGVLGLKRFIQFAQQENTAMDRNRADKESNENLIHQIATCLEKNGYKVNTSVGTSDFRIDIAVIDPLDDEKYILGIICDGERYYRLKTARDREIVQPSVLKRLGWNLMHVWALDWFMHPEMVTKNILERLENIK
jgi:KaiC/GvpD/RAD55 family RecA-like ATPase